MASREGGCHCKMMLSGRILLAALCCAGMASAIYDDQIGLKDWTRKNIGTVRSHVPNRTVL